MLPRRAITGSAKASRDGRYEAENGLLSSRDEFTTTRYIAAIEFELSDPLAVLFFSWFSGDQFLVWGDGSRFY